jgi:hypothetical protein
MADLNQQAQELAEIMERVNDEMRRYGKITEETAAALKAGSDTRAKELKAGGAAAADALGAVAKAGMASAKAMYDGQKGAGAFNDSLDQMSQAATAAGIALTFLIPGGPVFKLLVAGATAAVGALTAYTKAANDMADKLYKGYSGLAKSGAAASDGMTGVFEDAKKLGLSMNELDSFVGMVSENSKDMALFGGAVFEGRKKFADMGKAMEGSREGFLRLGMSAEEQAKAGMGYLRLQSQIGQTQNKTANELAESTRKYLVEQDALTKLTGMTREEQEKSREEIRSQERFGAKLMELRQQGKDKEAKALEDTYLVLRSQSKEAAQGFADISTNNVQTEAAQKSIMGTQGKSMEVAQLISSGQMDAATGAQEVAAAHGRTVTEMGATMGQIGTYNQTFGNLSDDLKLKALAEGDIRAKLTKIQEDQAKTLEGSGDKLVNNQAKLINTQIQANEATERFVKAGIAPAQSAMIKLAEATRDAAGGLNKLFGIGETGSEAKKQTDAQDEANTKQATFWEKAQQAPAKLIEGAGTVIAKGVGLISDSGEKAMQGLVDKAQAERVAAESEYLKKQGRYVAAPTANGAPPAAGGTAPAGGGGGGGGGGGAASAGGSAPPAVSGSGTTTASAKPNLSPQPPEGEAGPEQKTKLDDILKFTARSGSKEAFEGLSSGIKNAVIAAAEQYKAATGKPIQINSAKRDPEDQQRIYDETVAAGRPGIGPTGMKVAKPGRSLHEKGEAVDIQQYQDPAAVAAMNRQGLSQKVPNDPVHFQARDGGVFDGPKSGYDVTLHGNEAVIPLKGGAVPVRLDGDLEIGKDFGRGMDQGFKDMMSALVELSSGQLARNDLSENDKKQWQTALEKSLKGQQDVLNSIQSTGGMEKGMSDMADLLNAGATENSRYMRDVILKTGAQIQGMQTNAVLANPTAGFANIKSSTGSNDVSMEIDEKLKEVKIDTQSGFASALTEMRAEFTDSLNGIVDKISSQSSNGMQEQMLEALLTIARTTGQSADTSSKILQASRN